MTREEAKMYLSSKLPVLSAGMREAIKVLEQEPCEDCIRRADAKKYLSAPDANGDHVMQNNDTLV